MYFGLVAAAAVAAVATVAGAAISSGQQADAAEAAGESAAATYQDQKKILSSALQDSNAVQQPYFNTGTAAQNKLSYLAGLGNKQTVQNDLSYNAYIAQQKSRLAELQANKPSPKDKKAFSKWQQQKQFVTESLKPTVGSQTAYQNWKAKQPATKQVEIPIDSTYGSVLQDNPEKFNFEADPGYQFRKDQGNQALDHRLAGMGLKNSGLALKEGMRFNAGLADQTYNDAWQRYLQRNDIYNQNRGFKVNTLSGIASTGQHAADEISNNQNQYGVNVSNAAGQNGQAQQNAIIQKGNAQAAGTMGVANGISSGFGNYASGVAYGGGGGFGSASTTGGYGGGAVNEAPINNALSKYFG